MSFEKSQKLVQDNLEAISRAQQVSEELKTVFFPLQPSESELTRFRRFSRIYSPEELENLLN